MINSRSPYHLEYVNAFTTTTLAVTTTTVAPIVTTTTGLVYEICTVTNLSSTESLNFEFRFATGYLRSQTLAASSSVDICVYNPELLFQRTSGTLDFTFSKTGVACSAPTTAYCKTYRVTNSSLTESGSLHYTSCDGQQNIAYVIPTNSTIDICVYPADTYTFGFPTISGSGVSYIDLNQGCTTDSLS
jgi:hypothetical protein